eukprot:TRINITY_DN1763_c0_g2_i4.p1 TRINITY_DN1763_c0_g2~~TRINITY_DN1763_c0_g2_i4.p1  ORF type:complete len:517 (-),score=141.32 TRINITY_DN1763_c0_g2_i4:54-1604(-)
METASADVRVLFETAEKSRCADVGMPLVTVPLPCTPGLLLRCITEHLYERLQRHTAIVCRGRCNGNDNDNDNGNDNGKAAEPQVAPAWFRLQLRVPDDVPLPSRSLFVKDSGVLVVEKQGEERVRRAVVLLTRENFFSHLQLGHLVATLKQDTHTHAVDGDTSAFVVGKHQAVAMEFSPLFIMPKKPATIRLFVPVCWRVLFGIEQNQILQAITSSTCCNPSTLEELKCNVCCAKKRKVVRLAVTHQAPEYDQETGNEVYTVEVYSVCSSSKAHLDCPLVVLMVKFGPAVIVSPPFAIFSRGKNALKCHQNTPQQSPQSPPLPPSHPVRVHKYWAHKDQQPPPRLQQSSEQRPQQPQQCAGAKPASTCISLRNPASLGPLTDLHNLSGLAGSPNITVFIFSNSVLYKMAHALLDVQLGNKFTQPGRLYRGDMVLFPLTSQKALRSVTHDDVPAADLGDMDQRWYTLSAVSFPGLREAAIAESMFRRYITNQLGHNLFDKNMVAAGLVSLVAVFTNW